MQDVFYLVQNEMAVDPFQLARISALGTIVTMNLTCTVFAVHIQLRVKKRKEKWVKS
jgi:hypothetical protein